MTEAQTRYNQSAKARANRARYRQSEKGKTVRARYRNGKIGKAARVRYRNGENGRAADVRYRKSENGRAVSARALQLFKARHPERIRAKDAVNNALKRGKLVRKPCEVCGNPRTDGHHPDYSKPLEVQWLCQCHHIELHINQRIGGSS
jgi:hypothetical protein